MNIYDNIKEIIYINLDKRTDRDEYIKNFLNFHFKHIQITRFRAIEPSDATEYQFIKDKIKYSKNANKLPGITGCYCSHICILNRLFNKYKNKKTNDFVLIVEDTVARVNDWTRLTSLFSSAIIPPWGKVRD